MNIKSTLSTW